MSNIKEVWEKAQAMAEEYVKSSFTQAVARTYKEIVDKTPIDSTDTQQNWEINYGYGFQKPRGDYEGKLQTIIDKDKYKLGTTIIIRNQTPYAHMLEYGGYGPGPKTVGGFSKQAPKGMMRISALKFKQYLKQAKRDNKI